MPKQSKQAKQGKQAKQPKQGLCQYCNGRKTMPKSKQGNILLAMIIAYADPPYIGQAKKHYSHDPNCAEVDHVALIQRLMEHDGWALSLSSVSLWAIARLHDDAGFLVPEDARIGAWVKPFCSFKPNVNPAYAWEPVIFWGGRKRGREMPTVRDFISANITLKRGLAGVKPDAFSFWLFEVLGMQSTDTFVDMFPGSGAVSRAWQRYQRQLFHVRTNNQNQDKLL